jgi:hypothetical protein
MADLTATMTDAFDPDELAKAYRLRATELIWIAQGLRNPKSAAILLKTAHDYQRSAEGIERLAPTTCADASRGTPQLPN